MQWRERMGNLTQRKAAELLGVSRGTLCRWEAEKSYASTLLIWSTAYHELLAAELEWCQMTDFDRDTLTRGWKDTDEHHREIACLASPEDQRIFLALMLKLNGQASGGILANIDAGYPPSAIAAIIDSLDAGRL